MAWFPVSGRPHWAIAAGGPGGGGDAGLAGADIVQPTAGAAGAATFDHDSVPGGWRGVSIAIQPVTFTPDVSVAGNGTVTGTGIDCGVDCTEDYINGTDVELTGTPDAGWVLLEWLGAGAGSAPGTRSVTMDQDQALTAVFWELPTITVDKSASPTTVPEPGDDVEFTVEVTNNSPGPVELTSLVDSNYGDLDGQGTCALPQLIGSGSHYTCVFTQLVSGNAGDSHTNIVIATVEDAEEFQVEESDNATVIVTDVAPTLTVVKSVNHEFIPDPGGGVTYTVVVTNTSVSTDPVILFDLTDSVFGDLTALPGDCTLTQLIEPGDDYTCSFNVGVFGVAGDTVTDIVTATAHDDEDTVVAQDSNEVTVTLIPISQVTDSSLCTFSNDQNDDTVDQFRLIFTPDMKDLPLYKLSASNPGQFYYNVTYLDVSEAGNEVTLLYII